MLTLKSFMLTEEDCLITLREMKWPHGIACSSCSSKNVIKHGGYDIYQKYLCKECGYVFNDKTGTIFHRSGVPLRAWFFIALMMQSNLSILEISKILDMYYDPVYRMVKKLRGADTTAS
ncbi:MAG: transposase [Nitrososphaerales archaeon]